MLMMEPEAIERLCREQAGYSACVAYERERGGSEIVTLGEFWSRDADFAPPGRRPLRHRRP